MGIVLLLVVAFSLTEQLFHSNFSYWMLWKARLRTAEGCLYAVFLSKELQRYADQISIRYGINWIPFIYIPSVG